MSVSVGGKGYLKTINTKDKLLPVWEFRGQEYIIRILKNRRNKQSSSRKNTSISNYGKYFIESQEEYVINSTVEEYLNQLNRQLK